ncbi:MAG: DNA polymerase III subunit beta, partial [Bacteroidetes bacterium]|nr:DNA polymerase III subunit beta [Bacteroidota bacterium]
MMFSASSSDLVRAVQAVAGAISTKGALPILECILFERAGDLLRLSATDLEISIVEQVPVAFDSSDADMSRVAVPARR